MTNGVNLRINTENCANRVITENSRKREILCTINFSARVSIIKRARALHRFYETKTFYFDA